MKKDKKCCDAIKTSIGGQALIEGIMMRGPKMTAMAVRNPEGEIVLEKWETKAISKAKITKLPLIRGLFNFIGSMKFGYKCLMRSAEIAGLEDEEPKKDKKADAADAAEAVEATESAEATETADASETVENTDVTAEAAEECREDTSTEAAADAGGDKKDEKKDGKKSSDVLMSIVMIIGTVLGVLLAIGLFIYLPTKLYQWLSMALPTLQGNNVLQAVFEGVLRIVIVVGYMALVTLMKDIRRTFMYHGAEHKTIFCYEAGLELTVENVRMQKRFHPRCGTSFLILMVLVGVIISMFIPTTLPPILRTSIKLLLLPITVGIGYELIKLAGKHDNWLTRLISLPGVWLQHITVLEPTDDMIECAIAAVKEAIPDDGSDKW